MEKCVLKIQSRDQPPILAGDYIKKYISVWSINISLRVTDLRKKKGSYLVVFEAVEWKL
jgi:hypothetical protein